jgi:PPK2 family polyphosphate:nucleotide phosphotransferase
MARSLEELTRPYCITRGKGFRLDDIDPGDTAGLVAGEDETNELLRVQTERMAELQDMLYAQNSWALLVILQALDTAGKSGTIKHVMSSVNPQGCEVTSFQVPSAQELRHDFLWRATRALPGRGRIGIFNRSYYEEVLVVRVHRDLLLRQRLPESRVGKEIWEQRCRDMVALESYLDRNGVVVRKFYLHLSKEEQRQRFLKRLERPDKQWKFSGSDFEERRFWERYVEAYEDAIRATASEHAPWYVVPADHEWFTHLVVASAIVEALATMHLGYPEVPPAERKTLTAIREALEGEGHPALS